MMLGSSCSPCCEKSCIFDGTQDCVRQSGGSIPGYTGSSVLFNGGGRGHVTLNYFGVFGYWLGHNFGPTQSVLFSFGLAIPRCARVRVSALNDDAKERFNYRFTGASSVVFSPEVGTDFVDTGTSVTRPGNGDTRFRLEAEGAISEVFIEGEMLPNPAFGSGANGIIVEVCFSECLNCNLLP